MKINKDFRSRKNKNNVKSSFLEIDLSAISNNIDILKTYCESKTHFLAIVKADAYGHGAVQTAKKIASQVDWFAVNDVFEAKELRENDIAHPILVFMPPNKRTSIFYSDLNLTATVCEEEHLQLLPNGSKYHFLFDTGMGRLGFRPDEAKKVARLQTRYNSLTCTGLYSHFATADQPNSPKLKEQLQLFKKLQKYFSGNLLTHMCNTGAISQIKEAHFDMVRSGIGIYGFSPGKVEIDGLRPAMKWRTHLIQVKRIEKGECVSYGSTWRCPEDGFLGVIPVGFSDGLPRRLSGKLNAKIGSDYYSAAGIITMNYTMVYLQKRNFKTGTEVLLLGGKYTARDWADTLGTIEYEIMTGIAKNPKRYIMLS